MLEATSVGRKDLEEELEGYGVTLVAISEVRMSSTSGLPAWVWGVIAVGIVVFLLPGIIYGVYIVRRLVFSGSGRLLRMVYKVLA